MSKRGSYLGGSTVIGPRSGWFSKPKKSAKRTPEQIAKDKAGRKKKILRQMAKAEAKREEKRKRKEAEEERQRVLRAEKARKKAEREADPNYIAMMKRRAAKQKEQVAIKKRAMEDRMASIEVVRKPARRKPWQSE